MLSDRYPEITLREQRATTVVRPSPTGTARIVYSGRARTARPDVGESGKARGRGVCSDFHSAGLARGRCFARELRRTGFPSRRHSVVRQQGALLLDEIERSGGLRRGSRTWVKAEKHEGEGFVQTSTGQGWRAGFVLHGDCEKQVFKSF